MEHTSDFALRRTIRPYAAEIIVLGAVTLLWISVLLKTRDFGSFAVIASIWALFVFAHYGDTRYRVFWENDAIKQIAANKDVTIIKPSEINRIDLEQSDLQTLFQMRRPTRRIAIYANGAQGHKWIDVSLKHFDAEDIRRLMRAIQEKRPDLAIPKNWI
jgi:hypothetical protein